MRLEFTNAKLLIADVIRRSALFESFTHAKAKERLNEVLVEASIIVHKDEGNLWSTGRVEEGEEDGKWYGQVIFGGAQGHTGRWVDYAQAEEELHPYLQPAVEAHWKGDVVFTEAFEASWRA